MGLKLYFSNGLERLGQQLADNLKREQGLKKNVFDADLVIVPNPNVEKWLYLNIASQNQIAANIDFLYLETGLWKMIEMISPEASASVQLLSRKLLQLLIMSRHLTYDYSDAELKPIKDYLKIAPNGLDDACFIKMWQLSEQLSRFFLEYEYHRSEMVDFWLQKNYKPQSEFGTGERPKIVSYQAKLFNSIFGNKGMLDNLAKDRPRYLTLCQFAKLVLDQSAKKPSKSYEAQPFIHIFGHSQLSPFHRDLLVRISPWFNVRIYHLNVCSEYWEDISTPAEDRWRKLREIKIMETPEGEYLEDDSYENDLLKIWGRPGRETLRLFSQIEEQCSGLSEFESHWLLQEHNTANDAPDVLNTVKNQVLNRNAVNTQLNQDKSLQIAACPGIYREVETVYQSIVQNLSDNTQLAITDIAVLVPNMNTYGPVLSSVFTKEGQLPFSLIDNSAMHDSAYSQAVMALMTILSGGVNRKSIFELILNPCFREKFNLTPDECMTWLEWVKQLNICKGFTSVSGETEDSLKSSPFSWLHGLRRLRFGRIMDIPESDPENGIFLDFNGIVPYQHMQSLDTKSVSKLCQIVETLHSVASPLANQRLNCTLWKEKIDHLLDRFLTVPKEFTAEETVRRSLAESLKRMLILDEAAAFGSTSTEVPVSWLKAYIEDELAAISSSKGSYLSSGVSIASLHPMRPIPFSIIYVLGLGEGQFPRSDDNLSLNLIKGKRKIGDVNKLEADCYLFLETLTAAKHKLYLSYVSHDLQQDAQLYPGSILKQLMAYVNKHVLKPKTRFKEIQMPLKGSSMAYIRKRETALSYTDLYFNGSPSERGLLALALLKEGQGAIPDALLKTLKAEIDVEIGGFLERRPAAFQVQEYAADEPDGKNFRVTLTALTNFLKNPAEATLQRQSNLWEEKADDAAIIEDELFFRAFPISWQVPQQVVQHGVLYQKTGDALNDYIAEYHRHMSLNSKVPANYFGLADRLNYQNEMGERFNKNFLKDLADLSSKICFRNVTFGINKKSGASDIVLPPVELDIDYPGAANAAGRSVRVEIHGGLPIVWGTDENNFTDTLVILNMSTHPNHASRHTLNAFLFYVLAVLAGKVKQDGVFTVRISRKALKDHGRTIYRYSGMSPKEAMDYLHLLVQDYLFKTSIDLLPFDILTQRDNLAAMFNPEMDEETFAEFIRADIEDYQLSFSHFSREMPDTLKLAGASLPEDALHIARRRLGPIFAYHPKK